MTERLYLQDPYMRSFVARVLEVRDVGGRPAAVLDRSAFYPEGGGQPGDRGVLGAVKVLDTQERDGAVLHVIEKPIEPGPITAEIDWARRFDHMQQHHGQHLLSAAFDKLSAPTLSFHLGERTCTIDLDAPLPRLDVARAEALANESVWRDLPVVARDFTGEERSSLALRKEPVKGDRVVLVEGVDASPCGGTHPARTGEVGAIAVLRAQKWGEGKSRVEFACGGRVIRLLHEANETVAAAAEALKSAPADVAQAASRVMAESQARRKAAEGLLEELATLEAARLKAQGSPVVAKLGRGAAFARAVAQSLAQDGATALLAAVEDGRAHLVFARPKGSRGPAMGDLLKDALTVLDGKGGGGPDFAQGSGAPEKVDGALSRAAHKLAHP
jgi:alanyl-tRNA synthetase